MAGGIRINLDNASKEQLLNEVQQLKNKLQENDIKVKLDFDDGNINSIKDLVKNLQEQVKAMPLKLTIDDVNTQEKLSQIKGSFDKLKEAYDKLGTIKISKTFDDEGQLQSFVVNLEKMNGVIDKIKYRTAGAGIFEFAGGSQVDNINKTTQALEQFRSKWQSTLNEISGKGLIDNSTIQRTQEELDRLNLNNFKESSVGIKENINGLTSETNRLIKEQENLANAMGKVHEKSEQNIVKRQQTEQDAYNKSLEQEAIDRQKIQDAIAQTIAKREQENKVLEQNQAKAVNQALEEQYKQEQAEAQRISGFGQNVGSLSGSGLGMESGIKDVEKYVQGLMGVKASVTSIVPEIDKFGNEILKANISVDEGNNINSKYRITLDTMSNSVYTQSRGVQDLSSKHGTLSDQLGNSVKGILQWTASATLLFGSLEKIKQAIDYVGEMDNALTNLNKVVDLSKTQLDSMKDSALELGQELGKSSVSIMDAMAEAGRQFKNTDDIKKFTETAVMASNVTDMTAQQSAKSLTTVMSVFKQNINDVQGDLDSFNEIQNNYRVSGEDLAESIEKVGEAAAQTGTSMHELNGITTSLIQSTGLTGSEAGTSIRAILSRTYALGKDGDDGKGMKALKEAGIDVRDASGEFKSFSEILNETHSAWENMSKTQQMALAQAEGGTQHYSQFMTIMDNYDTVVKATNTSINSQGSALQENQKYLQSTEGKINQLKASAEKMADSFISSDMTKGVLTFSNEAIQSFGNLHTILTLTATGFALFKGTEILTFFKALPTTIMSSVTSMKLFQTTSVAMQLQEMGLLTTTEAVSASFVALGTSIKAAFLSNPLGWIATGISAVVIAMDLFGNSTEDQINKLEQMSQKVQQEQSDLSNLQDNLSTLNELHSKTSLTNDDKTKLVDINNDLASKYPELISYYDEESKSFQVSTQKLEELIKKKQELAMEENATNLQQAKDEADKAQKAIDTAQKQLQSGKKTVNTRSELGFVGSVEKDLSSSDRQNLIDTIGQNQTLLDKYNQTINQGTKYINDYISEQKKLGTSQNDIVKGLESYGYTLPQINSAMKMTTDSTNKNTTSTDANTQAKNANAQANQEQAQTEDDLQKTLSANLDSITTYGKMLNEINDKGVLSASSKKEIIDKDPSLIPYLSDLGTLTEELTNRISDLKTQSQGAFSAIQIEEEKKSIQELLTTYNELHSKNNLEESDKQKLVQVVENLKGKVEGLTSSTAENGKTEITNTKLITDKIKVLQLEETYLQNVAKVGKTTAQSLLMSQVAETNDAWKNVLSRIQAYDAEIQKLEELKNAGKVTENGGVDKNGNLTMTPGEWGARKSGNELEKGKLEGSSDYLSLKAKYDEIAKQGDEDLAKAQEQLDSITENLTSDTNDNTKATKENQAAQKALEATIKAVENQMKSYENQIKAVDNALYALDSQIQGMDETSDDYINALKEENNMYEQRIGLVNDIVDANGEYIDSIANMGGVSGTALGKEIIQKAESYLNTPYVWGGESPEGFDCSGLVQYVYKQFGIELGRTTYDQIDEGVSIPKQNLQPGDLVFFGDNASSPSHVGIYAGGDEFIESPHTGASVRISNLDNRSDYVGARRVISAQDTGDVIETSSSENSTYSGKYSSYINSAASKYGIPAALIAAVIENESGWTNPSANSAGAIGIMQVTKGSAEDSGYGNANLQDIQTNIMAGSAELARDLQAFDGNLTEAIAAYNAGIGAVQKYGGIPPYSETQNYVPKVLQSYQEYGGSDTVNLSDTATSKIEDILSKNQDYTKQNIDYQRKILENNTKIYEAYMNRYEKELSTNESQLNLDKERYSLYEEGNTKLNDSSRQYMQKEWQDINERYGILIEKQKFIEGELKNNIYDEKTVAQMKQDLQDIQLEETKTVNNLHTAFKDWLADRLTYNTQGYQDNIDMLNAQLDLVNEIDEASNYSSKASYNQQILEQQLKINDALKNQIDFVQKLYDKEQSGNTRLLWSEQLEDLNKQLVESQTNIEKAKKAMEDDVISGILDSVDKKLRLINDDLKDIQSATKDISDSNTSQKLIDNMNILQDQMTILIEDTNAYAELYSQVSADGTITSDEQSKLDSQSDKIRTDKENIQSSVQAINSLNLSNVIQPFENILSSLANNTNALKLQLDMLSSSSTDYATKAGLINEELNNNNLNMENLVSEYNELMNQTATPGTKEADDLTKALETVRDKIGEAAKEGVSLKNSLNDVKLSALFNQIETPQKNINQMLSNMDFVTSMSKAGQTNGLLIGGNYQDTTKNYEDQTLENEQETLDIINDINGKIEDLQSTTYDIDTSDLQNAVTEKIDTTNNLLQSIQDGITNINDNNSKTVETKNVYGTDYDLQYFKEIASKLGISGLFNYVDTNKSEYLDNRNKYKIGSNDIVLGGTGATGGISDSDTTATRLGGVDRSGTQTQIESYLKSLLDVLSNNSGSSNVDTEKTNQKLINTLNTGNTTTSAIATNTANDVNAVQEQTTTIISTDNANVANEIATITEQGQNITDGLSTVDTSIDIENSSIESLRTSLTTVLNSILEKINTLDTETSLQELINLHGSVNNIGDLIATVNELSFNPVASVSVKKEEDVNKKATGGTTEGWSIVGDGEGNNAGYELAILPDGRIIPVGQDGWELNKYPEGTQIIKHEDAVKLTGMKDISKYAEGTYKLYAQRADTNAEGLLGDYQYARQLLQTLGRTDIQLVAKDESNWGNRTLGDNDYIIGGSAVIASPEGFDESHRIWGATRKETESALQNFLSNHPMIATSSDINSLGSSNNATKPTSTSTSDYSTSTGSTGTGLSTTSNAGIINEDTETRKQINKNISNIQSAYNEQLSSSISTSELLKNQIALEQQSILLNNDALKQLKDQEILYKDDANALKKIADKESKLNKQIQDSQKKIQDLANSQVEQITAINDAKNKQLETDIKILGNVGNNTSNYQKQLLVLKDINGELLNYQDSLNKINNALTEEQDILNTFNSSNLSANENQSLKNLLLEQAKNGYLNTTDATILSNLETKLSDTDKTTLQGISAVLSAMYSKQFDIQQNITSTRENLISNIQTIITNNFNELEQKYEDAVNEQTEKLSDALASVQQANNKNEQLATLNKLQTQYNEAINNNSVEGRTQASDLRRQITEQQRKITETNMENMVSNTKTYLSEEVEKRKKIIEDAEKDLSNTMDLIKNGVISADDAITRFKEKWADDIKFLGSNLKINVLDILDQIQNITKDLNLNITTTSTINGEIVTNKIASMDKGGNTGDFNGSSDGKLSILHPEETVLTPFETSDILNTAKILENIKGYDLFTNNLVPSVLKSSDISKLVTTTNSPTGDTNHNYELNFQIANLNGTKNDADMLVNRVYSGIKRIGGDLSKVR